MGFEKRKVEWLEFDLLERYPHVAHGVFLRHGGASRGPYNTLNISDQVGDHPDSVKINREVIRKEIGLEKLFFANQVHGTNVHRVTAKNLDKHATADALFTTERNIGLGAVHADCQAAIFYDPVHEAIGVAHAGWKGLSQNIYGKLVATMHQEIGTQAHNLIVCISPSLGPDHAEYKDYKHKLSPDLWNFQIKPYYFDFWSIGKQQLGVCGVSEKNVELSELCTACNVQDYFSYREEKNTGRNATIVGLKT